jgi:hypothetical protein
MKTIQACTLIAILLLGFSVAGVSALTKMTFGGKSGDWIEYGFTQYLVSSLSSGPSEWTRMDFLSVEGANVTVNATVYTSSLTLWSETKTIDLTSQNAQDDVAIPSFFNARTYFIPAGLNVTDPVYLGQLFGTQNITGETTESYAGVDRTVIFTNFTMQGSHYIFYWDKQTGVLTEGLEYFGNVTDAAAYNDVLVSDTNMWSPPIIWPVLVWVAIALAIVLGVLSSRRSASKKARNKSDTKSTMTKTNSLLPFKQPEGKSY